MQQYLTYQHNVQQLFRDHQDKYDGVIIPLSIVTAFPSGTYGFIRCLCAGNAEKHYAIDPRNALFQKNWNRNNVRKPHEKMAEALGEPYISVGLLRALEPSDLMDESILDAHVKASIEMQLQFSTRPEDARKLAKYKKLLGVSSLGTLGMPQFLIPPYYQFESLSDPWYELAKRCITAALKYRNGVPIWPVLHFQEWNSINWPECLVSLLDVGMCEFWYYANNFKEHDASVVELNAFRAAVEAAHNRQLHPYVLFGGYFSILMSYFGLRGFGNGIGYGEWRDSGYHKGGAAATRIYLLKLHRYIDAPAAQNLVDRDPEYFGGDTEITAGYVDAGISLVEMKARESHEHFMECRRQEMEFVETNSIEAARAEIEETLVRLRSIGPLEHEKYGKSLERWQKAIEFR